MVNIAPCTWGSKGLPFLLSRFLLSQPVFYMPGPLSNSLLRSSLYIDMCNQSTIPGFRLEQLSPMCKCCLSLSQGIYSQLKVTSTDFWDLLLPATTWLHCEDRWCHAMHRQGAAPFLSLQVFGGGATWLSPFISGMVTKARGPWPLKWISAAIRKRAQSFLKIILIYLFIYLWPCWVFAAAQAFLYFWQVGAPLWLRFYAGFSLRWLLLLWSTGFRHGGCSSMWAQGLQLPGSRAQTR